VSQDDLWAAKSLFETRRVPFHAPIDWGDHHCLYFLDPDENLLELVHAPMAASPSRPSLPSKTSGG